MLLLSKRTGTSWLLLTQGLVILTVALGKQSNSTSSLPLQDGGASMMSGRSTAHIREAVNGSKLLIVTAVTTGQHCDNIVGGFVTNITLKNKEDYARLHGYGFRWTSDTLFPNLVTGPWNKIALLHMLASQKSKNRQWEWFMWVDYDTLFIKTDKEIPFDRYEGKDLVVWADEDRVMKEWDCMGVNTGVLLLRNTKWTRNFLKELLLYGVGWGNGGLSTYQQAMQRDLLNYAPGLYDQAAFVFALKRHPQYRANIYFETAESLQGSYGFHTHHSGNMPFEFYGSFETPLLVHYAGCQFCQTHVNPISMELRDSFTNCTLHWIMTYAYAKNMTLHARGGMPSRYHISNGRGQKVFVVTTYSYFQQELPQLLEPLSRISWLNAASELAKTFLPPLFQ